MENDLARRLAAMSDDALRQYAASAQLDEIAQALLMAELHRRGLLPAGAADASGASNEAGAHRPGYRQLVRGLAPLNAQILLGRLHADGIDAHLSGANIVQTDPLWFYALGGVRIFVHRAHLDAAFDVLDATWKGEYALAEPAAAPAPGSDSLSRKRRLGWQIVLAVALLIGGVSLLVLWWPSYQPFVHAAIPAPRISVVGRGMASVLLLAYVAFWLCFVEGVVRRQRRP